MAKSNQPAAKFRIGYVNATVWENENNGKNFYNVELSRTYKEDGEYKESNSFGHADLMNAVRVLQRAEAWISDQS